MRRNTIHNRGRRLMATIVAAAMFAVGIPAGAQETAQLPDHVRIHAGDGGDRHVRRVSQQVAKLWELVEGHARTVGMDEMPAMDIYVYGTQNQARAATGRSEFATHYGYALGSKAYLAMDNSLTGLAAHETLHILQNSLAGVEAQNRNYCLNEGASEWYATAVELRAGTMSGKMKQRAASLRGEYGNAVRGDIAADDITPNDVVSYEGFFRVAESDPSGLYDLCTVAFWLLMETGGGEPAYWQYLADSKAHGWKSAFERNFGYSWEDFIARFERFRDSGYVEMFTEEEKAERARAEAAEAARQIRIQLIKAILAGVCDPTARPCPE